MSNKVAYRHEIFLDLVTRMRTAQKNYFNTKEQCYLLKSKQLERQVDRYIDYQKNMDLFNE